MLAIAIVAIGSLTVGRTMLSWWQADPPAVMDGGALAVLNPEWGADGRPVEIEFGDHSVRLIRQVLPGSAESSLQVVRERCQNFLSKAPVPESAATPDELQQIAALESLTPDLEQPGNWSLYSLESPLPVIIGVKESATASPPRGQADRGPAAQGPAAQGPAARGQADRGQADRGRRVICWGVLFRGLSTGRWISYTFLKQPDRTAVSAARSDNRPIVDLASIALPPDSRRTLLLQEAGQFGMLGFQGSGTLEAGISHFDTCLTQQGWQAIGDWQTNPAGRLGSYQRVKPVAVPQTVLQIQLVPESPTTYRGMIHSISALPADTHHSHSPSELTTRGTP